MTSGSAVPPSPQEIQRKLSVRSAAQSPKASHSHIAAASALSGTESDSEPASTPDVLSPGFGGITGGGNSLLAGASSSQAPLSAIAERAAESGEDSEEEEEEEGGWKSADVKGWHKDSLEDTVLKAGYLWKKGERRKTWKKRWFVLRPAHLAYYKTSAEYQLLRLLELSDVHSCTPVSLKRHENTFGLVSPVRTFYLQAKTSTELQEWVIALEEARQNLLASSVQPPVTNPIPIPPITRTRSRSNSHSAAPPPITPSPPAMSQSHTMTSSDSEDGSSPRHQRRTYSSSSQTAGPAAVAAVSKSPMTTATTAAGATVAVDPTKTILSGYLMKCGSKRKNWRKRWFVLTGEKLVYSGSHMDTKPHRKFLLAEILDALEYELPANRQHPPTAGSGPSGPALSSSHITSPGLESADDGQSHIFKIVTTKRALLLCAPSEDDEIRWLGAIRALIARRSGAGVVPGESGTTASTKIVSSGGGVGIGSTATGGEPSSEGVTTSAGPTGFRGKIRRLSASGSSSGYPATAEWQV